MHLPLETVVKGGKQATVLSLIKFLCLDQRLHRSGEEKWALVAPQALQPQHNLTPSPGACAASLSSLNEQGP